MDCQCVTNCNSFMQAVLWHNIGPNSFTGSQELSFLCFCYY